MLLDYTPPVRQRFTDSHYPCLDCGRVYPRTNYRLRWRDDPYGSWHALLRSHSCALRRPLTPNECATLRLTYQPPAVQRRLVIQPICLLCRRARDRRQRLARDIRRAIGVPTRLNPAATELYAPTLPAPAVLDPLLEPAARDGITVVGPDGPVLPTDPTAALRVSYAALCTLGRTGPLSPARVVLLRRLRDLAAASGARISGLVGDVEDVALVREEGPCSSPAMERILQRLRTLHWKVAWSYVSRKLLSADEARILLDEGIYDAVTSWDPLHPSHATLGTHAGWRVRRTLQVHRTRVGRPIGARSDDPGTAARSLTDLAGPGLTWEVHGMSATTGVAAVQRPGSAARDAGHRTAVVQDVHWAISQLEPMNQVIARDLLLNGSVKQTKLARELGITQSEMRDRIDAIEQELRELLG